MDHAPEAVRPSPRRGPSVDLDPNGIVSGKAPDRQPRQFLNYAFYRLDPMFRRLPAGEQRAAVDGFIELVRRWESSDDLILRTYSLVGLRADVDFMLWRIAFDPLCFQSMEATIRRSPLGAYLSQVHSFLSLQRRSQYVNRTGGAGEGLELLPGQGKFLFVYPFSKTRPWYRLSPRARQGMIDEGIAALRAVPGRPPEHELQAPASTTRTSAWRLTRTSPRDSSIWWRTLLRGGEHLHPAGAPNVHVREGAHRGDPRATRKHD